MRTTSPTVWFVVLIVHLFTAVVFGVPNTKISRGKTWNGGHVAGLQSVRKTNAAKRKLTKSPSIVEKAQKKSELKKKTSVSINGRVLPIAGLSQTDKTVHVTVQNAATQENQQAQNGLTNGLGQQAVVQEVLPQNTVASLPQGTTPLAVNTPLTVQPLQGLPQPPGQVSAQETVGMSPPHIPTQVLNQEQLGMSPPITLGQVEQVGQVGMSPPRLPAELTESTGQIGMSPPAQPPGLINTGGQIGMSPPHPPAQSLANLNQLGHSPPVQVLAGQTLTTSQLNGNPQPACNPTTNAFQHNGKMVNLGTNSDGQLVYKPVTC